MCCRDATVSVVIASVSVRTVEPATLRLAAVTAHLEFVVNSARTDVQQVSMGLFNSTFSSSHGFHKF